MNHGGVSFCLPLEILKLQLHYKYLCSEYQLLHPNEEEEAQGLDIFIRKHHQQGLGVTRIIETTTCVF